MIKPNILHCNISKAEINNLKDFSLSTDCSVDEH